MANTDTADLDSRVRAYVKDWETSIYREIKSTEMSLLCCIPRDRGPLKTKLVTLVAVHDRLQGNPTGLKAEIAELKLKLEEAQDKQEQLADSLYVTGEIARDTRTYFQQAIAAKVAEMDTQEHNHQLKEAQNLALGSELKSAVNTDGHHKLEEAGQRSREAPANVTELVIQLEKSTRKLAEHISSSQPSEQRDEAAETETNETLQAVRKCMDVCVEMFGALQSQMETLESDLHVKDAQPSGVEDDNVISIRLSEFQTIIGNAVTEFSDKYESLLQSQKAEIAWLQSDDKITRLLQRVGRLHLRADPQNKKTKRTERDSRPRRRNWFQRLFPCLFGEGIEQ